MKSVSLSALFIVSFPVLLAAYSLILHRFLFSSFHSLSMAATASAALQITAARPSISSTCRIFKAGVANVGAFNQGTSWAKLTSTCHISSPQSFHRNFMSSPSKFEKFSAKAISKSGENKTSSGLPIDLKG